MTVRLCAALLALTLCATSACSPATDTPGQDAEGAVVLPRLQDGALASAERAPSPRPDARPLIVDTDLGADDLLALAHLLQQPGFDVLAVTVSGTGLVHCAAGVDLAADLVTAITGRSIPVTCGREESGSGRPFPEEWRDGTDERSGLPQSGIGRSTTEVSAAELIPSTLLSADAPVTILALGPMTNLADALALEPTSVAEIEVVHAMAGALGVPGNGSLDDDTSGDAEWNVLADPVSFVAVLDTGVALTLVPLDATNPVPADAALVDSVGQALSESSSTAAGVVAQLLASAPSLTDPQTAWWDALATVAMTDPELVVRTERMRVEVITEGESTGAIRRASDGVVLDVITELDGARFAAAFTSGL